MCGKVISGADYEQINSFGGGDFSNGQQIFHHEPNRRNTKKAAALMPRPKPFRRPDGSRTTPRTVFERIYERISNEPPDSPPTERFSNHPLGQIPDCRPNLFRAPSRRSFRLPFGGDSAPPSGQIPDRFPEEFQVVIPDRFQVAGRIPNRHPYEPQLGRTAAPEIAPKSGRHSRRRNVRPQPPYPNKRFSSAANLYPAFSTCASANSYEKMMKSRDSSYESV